MAFHVPALRKYSGLSKVEYQRWANASVKTAKKPLASLGFCIDISQQPFRIRKNDDKHWSSDIFFDGVTLLRRLSQLQFMISGLLGGAGRFNCCQLGSRSQIKFWWWRFKNPAGFKAGFRSCLVMACWITEALKHVQHLESLRSQVGSSYYDSMFSQRAMSFALGGADLHSLYFQHEVCLSSFGKNLWVCAPWSRCTLRLRKCDMSWRIWNVWREPLAANAWHRCHGEVFESARSQDGSLFQRGSQWWIALQESGHKSPGSGRGKWSNWIWSLQNQCLSEKNSLGCCHPVKTAWGAVQMLHILWRIAIDHVVEFNRVQLVGDDSWRTFASDQNLGLPNNRQADKANKRCK